jgi:hypothetical protein
MRFSLLISRKLFPLLKTRDGGKEDNISEEGEGEGWKSELAEEIS